MTPAAPRDPYIAADEYKMLFLEAITNSAKADGFEDVNLYPMYQKVTAPGYFGEEDTPWMKHIMRNGSTQQHRLSIRGGSQDFGYYASFGYANEEGMEKLLIFRDILIHWVLMPISING